MNKQQFLARESKSRDTIDFKMCYVDLCGDLIAGLLLSQIVYWNLPSSSGKTKLKVEKEGEVWLAKSNKDWYDEIRITEMQARRAMGILIEKKIVETQVFKFDGSPTTHIRINWICFLEQMEMLPVTNGNVTSNKSITKSTSETTSETTTDSFSQDPKDAPQISNSADSSRYCQGGAPVQQVFDHWNAKKIIVHTKLTSAMSKQIIYRLKEYSVDEIKKSIDNYDAVLKHKDTNWTYKWGLAEFIKQDNALPVFLDKSPADYAKFGKTIVIHNWNSKAYVISLLDKLVDATKGLSVGDHYDALRKILDEHGLSSWDVYCFNVVRSNYRDWKNGVSAAKPDIPLSRIVYDWETLKIARKPGRAFSDNNGSLPCDTLDKEGFIYKLFIDAGDTRKC